MDVFDRIEPVSRALLAQVEACLASLGAPPGHRIWPLLRLVEASPAEAVRFFAGLDPDRLRQAGGVLRAQAARYGELPLPTQVRWSGAAAAAFTQRLQALGQHLRGAQSLAGQLSATASYVEAVADWQQDARASMARSLAEAVGSADAVTLRALTLRSLTVHAGGRVGEVAAAAANVGAHVLYAAAAALAAGHDLHSRWGERLAQLPWSAPALDVAGTDPGTVVASIGT